MKVQCQACGARFKIQDDKVPEQGLQMNCPKCSAQMLISPQGVVSDGKAAAAKPAAPAEPELPSFETLDVFGEVETAPQPPEFGELNLDDLAAAPPEPMSDLDDLADTSFEFDKKAESSDDISSELGLDDDFSLDDALADLDDDMQLDSQDSLPLVPTPQSAPQRGLDSDDMILDEPLGDLETPDFDDLFSSGGASGKRAASAPPEDEFTLDMPGLLEDAAADLKKQGSNPFDDLPDLESPVKEPEFPDQGFSFDDMLNEESMPEEADRDTAFDPQSLSDFPELAQTTAPKGKGGDLLGDLPDLNPDENRLVLYQIQRNNGKIFGPFPQDTIIQMIADGKLVGTELVRSGEGEWTPITQTPPFSSHLHGAGKGELELDAFMPAAEKKHDLSKEHERIQEGLKKRRRASSLDVVSPMKGKRFKFKPIYLLPLSVLLLALVSVGYITLGMGYDLSEVPDVILGDSNTERPLYEQLKARHRRLFDSARAEVKRDNYQGYTQAREILLNMLKVPDFRGIGAVWALLSQVDFQLLRRYGMSPEIRQEAEQAMEKLKALKAEDLEITFAKVAQMMFYKDFVGAKDLLVNGILMQGHPNNSRALHLVAETYLYLPDPETAEKYLDRVISANEATAQTYYLQGRLYGRMEKTPKAKEAYSKALEIDPEHLDSQIELAGILLKEEGGLAKAERELVTIRNTFKDKMSRKQLGRVHYYSALIYRERNEQYKVVKELAAAIDSEPDNFQYNMTLGEFHFEKHEFEKALEQFNLCLTNNPTEIRCHQNLGRTELVLNHPDKALFKLEEAAKIAPNSAETFYLLGLTYEKLFSPDKALAMFEKAISLDPNGVPYYTSAAMSYLRQDNIAKAGEYIQKAKLIHADSPVVHNFLGQMHLHQNDVEKAIEEFLLATKADPTFIEAHLHLADTYRSRKEFEKAIGEYEQVLNLDDRADAAYFGLGRTYYLDNKLDKAITEFEKALSLNNRNQDYYYYSGVAYFDKGELDKSLAVLEKAAELAPGLAGPPFYIGRIYMDKSVYEKATEYLERALQIEPDNAEHVYYFGWLLEKQEKYSDAIDVYDRAIALDENYAYAYLRKGICLRAQNKFVPAIRMFRKAQMIDSTISMAHSELGDCYFEMRKYSEAVEQYDKVIKMDVKDADPYIKMGVVYQEMGNSQKAVTYFNRAVELDSENPQAYLGLGYANKRLRRHGEAVKSFEKYLELNPSAIDRQDVEDEIYYLKRR
jgi:predicted Zn finger-like uncharacterized protein